MADKPLIIGITGGSGSGKTLFINKILDQFPTDQVCLVSQDNYYRPRREQPVDENGIQNFDLPESINFVEFKRDLEKIISGETIEIDEYTYNNPGQKGQKIILKPAPIIVVEGIFIFHVEEIRSLIDLSIFIEAREYIMLKRRIIRDKEERGYDLEDVLYRFERHVMPTYDRYILPYRNSCDMVINNNNSFQEALSVLISHLATIS